MLDGFTVAVSDLIYDLLLQQMGSVTSVDGSGMFTVSFGPGKELTYATGGSIAGVRRAYWLNPVLTLPQKNDPQWSLLQAVVDTIRSS